MSIIDGVDSLTRKWKKLSLLSRVFIISLLVMQALSIASLANSVFEFKGFIVAGIDFYRALTQPVIDFIVTYVLIDIGRPFFDALTWVAIFVYAMKKAKNSNTYTYKQHRAASIFLILLLVIVSLSSNTVNTPIIFFLVTLLFLLALLRIDYKYCIKRLEQSKREKNNHFPEFPFNLTPGARLMVAFYSSPILLVSITAAISEGIVR